MSVDAGVEHAVLDLETKRIAAMVSRDLAALAPMLADDLSYSHSSGRTDSKASFLELVRSGHYLGVEFPEREVVSCGDAVNPSMATSSGSGGGSREANGSRTITWQVAHVIRPPQSASIPARLVAVAACIRDWPVFA